MKNKNLFYGITGLVVGVVIGVGATYFNTHRDFDNATAMHQMPDGSMMQNTNGMDMTSSMQGMMAGLQGKTGDAFDKEFLAEMIVHHQGAVDMAQAVLKTSKRPELIQLANDIITAQTKEISMMQGWQKNWFK